jgi:hypothetical protein
MPKEKVPKLKDLCNGRLVGKRVNHQEKLPYYAVNGTVESLTASGNLVFLSAKWDDGKDFTPSLELNSGVRKQGDGSLIVNSRLPYGGNQWIFEP